MAEENIQKKFTKEGIGSFGVFIITLVLAILGLLNWYNEASIELNDMRRDIIELRKELERRIAEVEGKHNTVNDIVSALKKTTEQLHEQIFKVKTTAQYDEQIKKFNDELQKVRSLIDEKSYLYN